MSLGIRNIRAISQSRGSREGNDAFTKVCHFVFVFICISWMLEGVVFLLEKG